MTDTKSTKEEIQSIDDYSAKYDSWAATISRALKNGREDLDAAMTNEKLTFKQIIEKMITAWDVSINFIRTEIKSGRSQARRMGLNRGVDRRQFHPAQLAKKKIAGDIDKAVDKALEGL